MKNNKRLIAKIIDGSSIVMTIDENLLSVEFGALDRGNLTDVTNWGIYANRGSISFIDKTGFFNNQNINTVEILGYIVKFYLAYENKETLISTFKIEDASFEEESREVTLQLISKLIHWTTKDTQKSIYPYYEKSLIEIIELVNNRFSVAISTGYNIENLYSVIGCPYFAANNLWDIMTKICQASMSRVVEDEEGNPIITGSFPKRSPILIKPSNIIDIPQTEFVRIKNSKISVTKRKKLSEEVTQETSGVFNIYVNGENQLSVSNGKITLGDVIINQSTLKGLALASGSINFATPYTIFKFYPANSYAKIMQVDLSLPKSTEIYSEKSFGSSYITDTSVLFSGIKENEIFFSVFFYYREISYDSYLSPVEVSTVTRGEIKIPIDGFKDEGNTFVQKNDYSSNDRTITEIESNDLIQDISYYEKDDGTRVSLGQYILDEVSSRYSNGIECFEIECLFNNYYDENGNKVFETEDLSKHFERYDIIIPYVQKQGRTVPLRVDENGNPKKFRIIGISYSYDGLLKQKLSVQEERYYVD